MNTKKEGEKREIILTCTFRGKPHKKGMKKKKIEVPGTAIRLSYGRRKLITGGAQKRGRTKMGSISSGGQVFGAKLR